MVLDTHLAKTGTGYLVGDKLTYADLAFVPWHVCLDYIWRLDNEAEDLKKMLDKYPTCKAWMDGMTSRQSFKDVWKERAKANKH